MSLSDSDPGFWTRTSYIQLTYGMWVNVASLTIGLAYGFPAVQIPQLNSPDSDILLTTEQTSWIASVLTLFCPIGCMISGFLMDRFGRRSMLMWCQMPMCLGWLFTALSNSANAIIIGRIITGIGAGMAMGPPRLYTAEISLPNMRGLLGALPNIFLALGLTIQAAMGSYISWKSSCYICGVLSLFLFLAYFLLPETPYFLLLRDTTEKARKVLHSFRAKNYNIEKEMEQLTEFKTRNNILHYSLTYRERLKSLFTCAACKPFAIIMAYILIVQLSGASIFTFWTVEMLQLANSSVDAYEANVYVNFTRFLFAIISSVLIYHVGRRVMAMVSACGVSASCTVLGVFLCYYSDPSIAPLLSFICYMAFASLGFYCLPFFLMSELYPLLIRGTLTGISISLVCILMFISTKSFIYMKDNSGMAEIMLIFGGFALFGAIALYLFLPETKGLTLQEIEEYYSTPQPRNSMTDEKRYEEDGTNDAIDVSNDDDYEDVLAEIPLILEEFKQKSQNNEASTSHNDTINTKKIEDNNKK